MPILQIISVITLFLVGIVVFELRAIKKKLTAHETEMPHWFEDWLKAKRTEEIAEAVRKRDMMRLAKKI